VDTTALVDVDIELGKRVTKELDASGIPVKASLWFYAPEASEWRLIVATPFVDQKGPQKTYSVIQKALKNIDLPLRKISAVSPNDPLIRLLRAALRTGPGISGIRFTHNTINNVFVEDAYIYRLS
jgi:hypothetical protein